MPGKIKRSLVLSALGAAGVAAAIGMLSVLPESEPESVPVDHVIVEGEKIAVDEGAAQLLEPSQDLKPATNYNFVVNADYQVSDLPSYPEFKLVAYQEESNPGNTNGGNVWKGGYPQQTSAQPHSHQRPRDSVHRVAPRTNYVPDKDLMTPGSPPPPARLMMGVDGNRCDQCEEPRWQDATMIPWERFSYGEYLGPHRTPHVPEYRIRVRDQLEFVFMLTREQTGQEYRIGVGDTIAIVTSIHAEYNQPRVLVLSDGSISLPLIGRVMVAGKTISELEKTINSRYIEEGVRMPQIVIQGIETNRKLQDLRDAVDARAGVGGQSRQAEVGPDGTIQLPKIHSVPAVGLTLKELAREVNARFREKIDGIEVTPILVQRAPRVAYVLGEVVQPGRVELVGPTSAMQSIALAQGWNIGGNLRQIIVFRRDQNWNLMATRLDLAGALHGRRPHPSDEIWLRDGDIVLVPKQPIQRMADAIELYFTRSAFAIFPNQAFAFNFGTSSGL